VQRPPRSNSRRVGIGAPRVRRLPHVRAHRTDDRCGSDEQPRVGSDSPRFRAFQSELEQTIGDSRAEVIGRPLLRRRARDTDPALRPGRGGGRTGDRRRRARGRESRVPRGGHRQHHGRPRLQRAVRARPPGRASCSSGCRPALGVLLLVFGAVVAGLIPLLMALCSIAVALGLVARLSQAFDLSVFIVNMLTGMGLALGIDYSLFVISRYREERRGGREPLDASAEARVAGQSFSNARQRRRRARFGGAVDHRRGHRTGAVRLRVRPRPHLPCC
jgi:hypothetical protein